MVRSGNRGSKLEHWRINSIHDEATHIGMLANSFAFGLGERFHNLHPKSTVMLHHFKLFFAEFARVQQNRIRNPNLANIVQLCRQFNLVTIVTFKP